MDNALSNFVPELDSISDEEIVMFNIGLTNNDDDLTKIQNILQNNNLEFGNKTNQWYIRREELVGTDEGKFELFSPMMTAKQAREIIPKLISDFDKAKVSSGLVVPIKAKELFANLSKNSDTTEINQDKLKKLIIGAYFYKDVQYGLTTIDDLKKYGIQSKDELPTTFYSLDELEKQYPKDKFLFSGSTASDDFLLVSCRAGRTGTVYATPSIEYAAKYDGVTNIGSQEGTTATGDRYVSSVIGKLFDKDIKVGFINVYYQSPRDMFFSNFGMEDCRQYIDSKDQPKTFDMCEVDKEEKKCKIAHKQAQTAPNKLLTRDQAINGYVWRYAPVEIEGKEYMPFAFNSETFVTPEKNPLYEKILHIEWNNTKMFIPVNKNKTNDNINVILNKRKADVKHTFQYGVREDVFDRLQKQEQEYKTLVFEKAIKKIPKKDNSYNIDLSNDR